MKLAQEFLKVPLAHRGLHDERADENSSLAFSYAVNAGYGIELDVHVISDGSLLVFHDRNLSRILNVDVDITSLSLNDRYQYLLPLSGEVIPTLSEVLEIVNGQVPLLIELKVDGPFNELLAEQTIKALEGYPAPHLIAIQSFNPFAMKYLRKNHPNKYAYGQLVANELEGYSKFTEYLFKTMKVTMISKPNFIAYNVDDFPNKYLRRKRRKGMPVLSWTIKSDELYAKAIQYADNVIFEKIRPTL